MPQITAPDGSTQYIPGVYTDFEVVSSAAGSLPAFQIPIGLGSADFGRPYDFDTKRIATLEDEAGPFVRVKTGSATARAYGAGSDVHTAMVFAKRHGLPFAFVACLSNLVRAEVTVTSLGPVSEFTLVPRDFGALPGHTLVLVTGGVATFTPVKQYTPALAAYAASDTRVFVRDNSWLQEGTAVLLGRNGAVSETLTVAKVGSEIGADGRPSYWVEFTTPIVSAGALIEYPYIVIYDTNKTETHAFTTGQELVDSINTTSKLMLAEVLGTFSNAVPIDVPLAIPLKDIPVWGAVTVGTSPAATATDVAAFITQMNAGDWRSFALRFRLLPQSYLLAMPDAASHIAMRDYATAERLRGFPISVVTGGAWGDVVLDAGDSTDPLFRASGLNSQDVMLAIGGMDEQAPYLSFAPAIFGLRVGGGPGHNLTQDSLIFSTLEAKWDEINSGELTRLHQFGTVTYRMATSGSFPFVVSQGLSTLQSNTGPVWNEVTAETWSVHQRDLADFFARSMREVLDQTQLGGDATTADSVKAVMLRKGKQLARSGFVVEGTIKITGVEPNANRSGWDAEADVSLAPLTDYISVLTRIRI